MAYDKYFRPRSYEGKSPVNLLFSFLNMKEKSLRRFQIFLARN